MSWDVYALRPPPGTRHLDDVPDGYCPPALGAPEDVIERLRQVVPHVVAADLTWLRLEAADHTIEISLGKGAQVRDLTFFISGGAVAVPVVRAMCRALAVTAYDTETGELLTAESAPPAIPPPQDDENEPKGRWWWRR